jgi:hypothetical protein
MREDTKLAKIRAAMREGDWDAAFRVAARFQRLGAGAEAIRRAADAGVNPGFYRQLGFDLDEIKHQGIAALKERFSKSWQESQQPKK